MNKVTFYDTDKNTVLDVEYYEDSELDELQEDIMDHGEEFVTVEYNSSDFEGYERYHSLKTLLAASLIRVMDEEFAALDAEMKNSEPHQFSEDFERNIAKIRKGA